MQYKLTQAKVRVGDAFLDIEENYAELYTAKQVLDKDHILCQCGNSWKIIGAWEVRQIIESSDID